MEYKLALVSKQNNQQNRIKEYLQNYPENIQLSNINLNNTSTARPNVKSTNSNTKLHSLSSNDTGKARPSVRSPNNNTNNETTPLLPKPNLKKKGFLQRIFSFRRNTA